MMPMVFSIRPRFVARFRHGAKRYELRTRVPRLDPGDVVLIYETAPTSKIVATATIGDIRTGRPDGIRAELGLLIGVTDREFDDYFAGRDYAVAIRMEMTWLPVPLALPQGMTAPQSWARLRGDLSPELTALAGVPS